MFSCVYVVIFFFRYVVCFFNDKIFNQTQRPVVILVLDVNFYPQYYEVLKILRNKNSSLEENITFELKKDNLEPSIITNLVNNRGSMVMY